jgi:hypothetical protein
MAAARGHFEVFPVPDAAGWRWRFLDDQGHVRATSPKGLMFSDAEECKAHAAALVIAVRTSTYGQRFVAEIADAVLIVDV